MDLCVARTTPCRGSQHWETSSKVLGGHESVHQRVPPLQFILIKTLAMTFVGKPPKREPASQLALALDLAPSLSLFFFSLSLSLSLSWSLPHSLFAKICNSSTAFDATHREVPPTMRCRNSCQVAWWSEQGSQPSGAANGSVFVEGTFWVFLKGNQRNTLTSWHTDYLKTHSICISTMMDIPSQGIDSLGQAASSGCCDLKQKLVSAGNCMTKLRQRSLVFRFISSVVFGVEPHLVLFSESR